MTDRQFYKIIKDRKEALPDKYKDMPLTRFDMFALNSIRTMSLFFLVRMKIALFIAERFYLLGNRIKKKKKKPIFWEKN